MTRNDRDKYVMLMSSLPSPDGLFTAKHPPLSRIKLEQRLSVLSDKEKHILRTVEQALDWRLLNAEMSNEQLVTLGKQAIEQVHNHSLSLIIRNRLEIRTILAALRMRHQGHEAPRSKHWGIGRWQAQIKSQWHDPSFGLGQSYPWIILAQKYLNDGDAIGLDKLVLEQAFTQLQRFSHQHLFDFEAVVIYVLKWNLLARSVKYNGYQAKQRFSQLVDHGMADAVPVFAQEAN